MTDIFSDFCLMFSELPFWGKYLVINWIAIVPAWWGMKFIGGLLNIIMSELKGHTEANLCKSPAGPDR